MPHRSSKKWHSRRKHSLGKLRRAHPASGATWNVQVVKGKMTSKCLWHACRALALGMILMLLGAGMATIGYYADQLSTGHEIRGNETIRVKNESRGFHLNNLSYAGPIVMGFGGFIIVAACVMTFEARESAAKVVPARFKVTTGSKSGNMRSNSSSGASARRANGLMHQTNRWDHHLGVFRTSPAETKLNPIDRQALTAALIHFSQSMKNSPQFSPKISKHSYTGSVPNLPSIYRSGSYLVSRKHHHRHKGRSSRHHASERHSLHTRHPRFTRSLGPKWNRESTNSLLHPGLLLYKRHALSVDETGPYFQANLEPTSDFDFLVNPIENRDTRLIERNKRSDTAKRHILARQKPIEKDESLSRISGRNNIITADITRSPNHRLPSVSRALSMDSRSIQVELHSPNEGRSPQSQRRFNSIQSSTPSFERELRSQLSLCSEPVSIRQLSVQSSIEPCVLEESPEQEDKDISLTDSCSLKRERPDSLNLDQIKDNEKSTKIIQIKKNLFRSSSSRTFYRPKPKPLAEYDNMGLKLSISNDSKNNDSYDSLEVINERRKTMMESLDAGSTNNSISEIQEKMTESQNSEDINQELNEEILKDSNI